MLLWTTTPFRLCRYIWSMTTLSRSQWVQWILFIFLLILLRSTFLIIIRSRSIIYIFLFNLFLNRFRCLKEKTWFLVSLLNFSINFSFLFCKFNQFVLSSLLSLFSRKPRPFFYDNLTKLIYSYNIFCFLILLFEF
jgi:hypothetical protein